MPLAPRTAAARFAAFGLGAVLALMLLATPGRSAPAATKWHRHGIKEVGSLSLPASWRDMTKPTRAVQRAIQRVGLTNPRVAPLLYALTVQRTAPYVKFVGADFARPSLKHGFATNVNLLAQRTPVSLDAWARANLRALQRTLTVRKPIRRRWMRLPAGRTLELRFQQKVQAGDHLATVAVRQYGLKRGAVVYLLTYSTTPGQARSYARVFAQSARSLRLR